MMDGAKDKRLDLSAHDRGELARVLSQCVPGYEVWAMAIAELRDALDESDLTIKVDVVDWARTSDAFRRIIEKSKIVVQRGPVH